MAETQFPFRANIQTSVFPLLSQLGSQTIIVPDRDQTYVPNVNPSDQVAPVDRGVPQIFYCHNVMPSTYGFQSVSYKDKIPGQNPTENYSDVQFIVSEEGVRSYINADYEVGHVALVLNQNLQWTVPAGRITNNRDISLVNPMTVATINGVSYICFATYGIFKYVASTNTLEEVIPNGLDPLRVNGLLASSGYLIAWTNTGIAWSSVNDPLDFEPSDISGAGSGEIQEAQGNITHCQKTSYGFIIYTTNNAVSATYSGNTEYPFNFKSIPGAGGLKSKELVCVESTGTQYAYTTKGLQQVYHTGAKTVLPYITDFISGDTFEDYDSNTGLFNVSVLESPMNKRITLVCDRYLIISYSVPGETEYTHAIVLDIIQSRMGKLRIRHTTCFELLDVTPDTVETPRDAIAFMDHSGQVKTVDLAFNSAAADGVILLGKYQIARQVSTILHSVVLENIPEGAELTVTDLMSYDGKNFRYTKEGIQISTGTGLLREYAIDIDSTNHSLLIKGAFNLVGVILWMDLGGDSR